MELNAQQLQAVDAVRGPVCIVAGAGTGKTTTVTMRIARQVQTGAFSPREVLAVTFTRKAAGELRERLAAQDVRGVEARTFHSAAWWMLQVLWPACEQSPLPRLEGDKYSMVAPLVRSLPKPYRFRPVRDVTGMLEYAANRGLSDGELLEALEAAGIEPALPEDLYVRVARAYRSRKTESGIVDFEDALIECGALLRRHPEALARIQRRFRAFTVDEYQDVNPLQQDLLDLWTGATSDVCVVGDDHQTIYSFTGATPVYLLDFHKRYPDATVVALTENYRSSRQVLAVANAVAAGIAGTRKQLTSARDGAQPTIGPCTNPAGEAAAIAERCEQLHAGGMPWHEMAVLYRTNDQSTAFEQALGARGIPVTVAGRGLLQRQAWRQLQAELRGLTEALGGVAASVTRAAKRCGYGESGGGAEEQVRQSDLELLVAQAERYEAAGADPSLRGFASYLVEQFGHEEAGGAGVQLMSLHRAKGLEFDAVFLPTVINGVLPYWKGKNKAPVAEERRLLFVGITRAREHLQISWPVAGKATPSFLLTEAGLVDEAQAATARAAARPRKGSAAPADVSAEDELLFDRLSNWRRNASGGKPAYTVFDNKTLWAIVARKPRSLGELALVSGVGPAKLEKYGEAVLGVLAAEQVPASP